jgi:hypothetical protein
MVNSKKNSRSLKKTEYTENLKKEKIILSLFILFYPNRSIFFILLEVKK